MSKKILIVGGGYAGIRVATTLMRKKGDFEATIIDEKDYHTEKTCLHEVATGEQKPDKIIYPINECVDGKKVKFVQDKVVSIDKDSKIVKLEKSGDVSYDYLVIALGFESETFGIEGVNDNAYSMVNLDQAIEIHKHILGELEAYSKDKNKDHLRFVIVGAGFTGIELLGAMAEQLPKFGKKYGFTMDDVELTCVEAATRLLPMFSEKLANYAIDYLKKLQAHFLTGAAVKKIEPGKVIYMKDEKEGSIEANTIIWTTGVSGTHLIEDCGFEKCRRGRVVVHEDLTIDGYDNIFMLGDVAAVLDPNSNRPYPTTAQIALAMADVCADNLIAKIQGKETKHFNYVSKGTVCSLGNCNAIGKVGKMELKGYPASALKKIIETKAVFQGSRKFLLTLKKGRFDLFR